MSAPRWNPVTHRWEGSEEAPEDPAPAGGAPLLPPGHQPYDYDRTDTVDYESHASRPVRSAAQEAGPPEGDGAEAAGPWSARSAAWVTGSLVFVVTLVAGVVLFLVSAAHGEGATHDSAVSACRELMVAGDRLPLGARFSTTDYSVTHDYADGTFDVRGRIDTPQRTRSGRLELGYVCDGLRTNDRGTWTANYVEASDSS